MTSPYSFTSDIFNTKLKIYDDYNILIQEIDNKSSSYRDINYKYKGPNHDSYTNFSTTDRNSVPTNQVTFYFKESTGGGIQLSEA